MVFAKSLRIGLEPNLKQMKGEITVMFGNRVDSNRKAFGNNNPMFFQLI
tara:strand:+ start:315 stop:461 length:147 start_codon:yes stop_codon:yes gene_type:complete